MLRASRALDLCCGRRSSRVTGLSPCCTGSRHSTVQRQSVHHRSIASTPPLTRHAPPFSTAAHIASSRRRIHAHVVQVGCFETLSRRAHQAAAGHLTDPRTETARSCERRESTALPRATTSLVGSHEMPSTRGLCAARVRVRNNGGWMPSRGPRGCALHDTSKRRACAMGGEISRPA